MDHVFLRPLAFDPLRQVLLTVGFAFLFQQAALDIWTGNNFDINPPDALTKSIVVGGLYLPLYRIFMIATALIIGVVLWLAMEKTRMGAAVRATVDDAQMARGVGIDTSRISMLIFVVAVAAIAILVPNANSFVILLTTRALAFSILVMSLDILLGYTGLPSLGQAAYLGVGAYLTAILATRYQFGLGYDFWLVVVFGILIAAVLAAVFGLLAIRASGVYFLMITLALGQCAWGLAYRWNSLTGGDNGINLRGRPKFGIDLANEVTFFFLVFGFFVVSLLLLYTLVRSPFGRSLMGIRERELRMKILGYNTWLHKYVAFIIAGGFGGLAGVLWAHTAGIVSPENVVLTTSVDALLMAVLGGAGTLVGGVIGALIVFGLREYLSTLVPWWQYVLGGVYVLTILFLPTGLMGIPERIRQRQTLSGKREDVKEIAPVTS